MRPISILFAAIALLGMQKTAAGQYPYPLDSPVSDGYSIAPAIFTGTNTVVSAINSMQLYKEKRKGPAAVSGIVLGLAQIGLSTGYLIHDGYVATTTYSTTYNEQELMMLNFGLGTATAVLGICNLAMN